MAAPASFSLLIAGKPPTCEASIVKLGYIWLLVLAPTAGLVIGIIDLLDQPSLPMLALAAACLWLGYLAWRWAYRRVRLELRPDTLHIQPTAAGQPAEDIPLTRIANYLRPQESYYQILELQLHGGSRLRFSKRMRIPAGELSLDEWTEILAGRLEQTRPVLAVAGATAPATASGLLATPPRIFARTTLGKILAGLATVWLLLAIVALLGPDHVSGTIFLAPSLYLGYYFRARGELKVQTRVLTGSEAERDDNF